MPISRREVLGAWAALAGEALVGGPTLAGTRGDSADRLWYTRPASVWTEALPVGNGRLGAMVFGGIAQERIQLNEDTLWSGGPYDPLNPAAGPDAVAEVRRLIAERKFAAAEALANERLLARPLGQMAYQTFGDLFIEMEMGAEATDYRRELDLDQAVATTWFALPGSSVRREVLASVQDQVIAIRVESATGHLPRFAVRLATPHVATISADGHAIVAEGHNGGSQGIAGALRLAAMISVQAEGGHVQAADGMLVVERASAVTMLVALATSYKGHGDVSGDPVADVSARIAAARRRNWHDIRRAHVAEHRKLYCPASLDLGPASPLPTDARIAANVAADEPALAALYFAYARYLLISSSRPGTQPANLQGIWCDSVDPPWGSKYTININTEMNYWIADPANLGECAEPLLRMVQGLAQSGAKTAKAMYGARGWVAHHNTDLWRASSPIDGAAWGMWPLGGAWLCDALWDRWDYGRDRAWLAAIYPLMRGAAEFFLDTLQKAPEGLVTSPSISPENRHPFGASVCAGPAMDRQILRDLFARTADAAEVLGRDAGFAAELLEVRARLAPDRVGKAGQLQEWLEDWDEAAPEQDHRHVSHLYALYPGHQIDPDRTPELAAAAKVSLNRRGDQSTGWATAWRIALWARLRDGERAHFILRGLLGPARTYTNLFDAHPPFQIDGNFGGAAAIAEMLLQGERGRLHLLPALPRAWPEGRARGLVARGGVVVDLTWSGGVLAEAVLRAMETQDCEVRLGEIRRSLALKSGQSIRLAGPNLTSI